MNMTAEGANPVKVGVRAIQNIMEMMIDATKKLE